MLFYRAALPLPSQTLTYVAGIIRRYRRAIGSCWRKLNPGQQARLSVVHLEEAQVKSRFYGVDMSPPERHLQGSKTQKIAATRDDRR